MRFTFDLPTSLWHGPPGGIVMLGRALEAAGIERFGIADWRFFHDPYVVMTALLGGTRRLEVETLVTDPYVRHPALTACAHATMDDLSRGRTILGLGGGHEQPTFWGYGRPHPLAAMRDAVEIIRGMLRGERVTHRGEVISVENAALDFTPFRPDMPILIAARGRRMIELAAEVADIVHLASFFVNVPHHRRELEHVRIGAERGARAWGSFEIDISMPCSVSDDRAAARRAAKRPAAQGILWMAAAEKYSRQRRDWERPKEFSVPEHVVRGLSTWDFWTQPILPDHLADLITDDVLDQFALAGTPAECAERLRALRSDLPEMTGVRLYALPPHGRPRYEGWLEMAPALGRLRALTNA